LTDRIHLLPDNIANQIAAGEVIQRPGSAVKELLENAVDAGADEIRLIVNDAGKSLVQVTDNGQGMSETDARMSFERHATSKITAIDDLFRIRTMGFRGEALASIAAVSQVEMKTRRAADPVGTFIEIDNSRVTRQEPCSCAPGTSIAMKNLFFNVPARRNFLKGNAAEMRHVVDEFIRVALAFPELFFSLTSNGQEIYHLEKGSLKQRIVQVMGSQYASKLVGVQEKTDYLNIYGFTGKPDAAKKTRGDQYLFVNNRFIRSAYLNHAVMSAYQDLIPDQSWPMYVLFIDLDPAQLDINVHPTKQEIKFEDEKIVYAFVQAAVKHALAQYSVTPTLDFELDPGIQNLSAVSQPFSRDRQESATSGNLYRTFTQKYQAHRLEPAQGLKDWEQFFKPAEPAGQGEAIVQAPVSSIDTGLQKTGLHLDTERFYSPLRIPESNSPVQLLQTYILLQQPDSMVLVHQQLAHQQVLFEKYSRALEGSPVATQRSLFPATVALSPADAVIFEELLSDLHALGYHAEPFGKHTYVIQGTPADIDTGGEVQAIENLIESYKQFATGTRCTGREKLIRTLARQHSIRPGVSLSEKEMKNLVGELSNCKSPNLCFTGNPTYIEFKKNYLDKLFGN
jgi:DNA mismatch repair protein MutL